VEGEEVTAKWSTAICWVGFLRQARIVGAETGPRLEFRDAKSNWIGYGWVEGGQGKLPKSNPNCVINLYDHKSNSIGYAKPGLDGQTLDLFDGRSYRLGTIKLR